MTVSSTSSRVVYQGDGSTTVWPFAFKVQQAADLVVVYTDTTGTDFTLSGSQYAATGFGLDAGGTVTYPPSGGPIAAGTRLTIYRSVAVTQPTSISNQGAMWPSVIEAALDRLTFIAQKVSDSVSRALVISPTDGNALGALPNATTRANSVLGFDSSGQPVAVTLGSTAIAWATWLVNNFASQATSAANACAALVAAYLPGNNTFTGANSFTGGAITVPTRAATDSTTNAASTAMVQAAIAAAPAPVIRSYLAGLTLSNDGVTPNSKLDVAAGVCADDTNAAMLALAAGVIDCTTTGASGLDAGTLAANTWYHVHAIAKAGGASPALLASTSASAPTLPATYTLKRRLGSFRTDGAAHILPFTQLGDEFLLGTPVVDISGLTIPTTASTQTLSYVPTGVKVTALLGVLLQAQTGANVSVLFSALDAADIAPSATGIGNAVGTNTELSGFPVNVRTNVGAQIRVRASSASLTLYATTLGWIDRRGRDA